MYLTTLSPEAALALVADQPGRAAPGPEGDPPMKILRVRHVGMVDGEPHYRVKVQAPDGTIHRIRARHRDLAHPHLFNRRCEERLGKRLLGPEVTPGDFTRAVADALQPATFNADVAAGQRSALTGLPTTTGIDVAGACRQIQAWLVERLKGMIGSGEADPDELEAVLEQALEALGKLEDR